MTVSELSELLSQFPSDFPVYICPQFDGLSAAHSVVAPQDAIMNLVEHSRLVAMGFDNDDVDIGKHTDAVVIPVAVR
jgi:hypothetical protein